MEYRIFFKDKENELKGPFTERQIQEWYRKGWFDSSFPFYFTQSGESPPDEKDSGITLALLRSLNGPGCPFFKSEGNEKSELDNKKSDEDERLKSMKKEIAELRQQFDAILCLKKTIERAEREVQKASSKPSVQNEDTVNEVAKPATSDSNIDQKTPIAKPESIAEDAWQTYYKLGNSVADFFMYAFDVFQTGDLARFDKERAADVYDDLVAVTGEQAIKGRNLVCEHILVEKMKEKDFFFCHFCEEAFFNYKQALLHFATADHARKTIYTDATLARTVLDTFAVLPNTLFDNYWAAEQNRIKKYGGAYTWITLEKGLLPEASFLSSWRMKYCSVLIQEGTSLLSKTKSLQEKMKSDMGRNAFAELHNHLAQGPTWCKHCLCRTGTREEFYAHILNTFHVKRSFMETEKRPGLRRVCVITILVNVHRRDLI